MADFYPPLLPPEKVNIPFDETMIAEAITSQDPADLIDFLKEFIRIFQKSYSELADCLTVRPEYQTGGATTPQPAEGQFLMWKDGSGDMYLCYADSGDIYRVQLTKV